MVLSKYKSFDVRIPIVSLLCAFLITGSVFNALQFNPFNSFLWGLICILLFCFALINVHNPFFINQKIRDIQNILNNPLTYILLGVMSFRLIFMFFSTRYHTFYDTSSYVTAANNLISGHIDEFRTPIYPLFLALVSFITGAEIGSAACFTAVAAIQQFLSVISLCFFYSIAHKVIKSDTVANVVTVIYGCAPMLFQFNSCILTESLTLLLANIFLYFVIGFIQERTYYYAVVSVCSAVILIFTRPTFVYLLLLLPLLYVAFLMFQKGARKQALAGILASVFAGIMVLGYCSMNYSQNGIAGLSTVTGSKNELLVIVGSGIYKQDKESEIGKEVYESYESKDTPRDPLWYADTLINKYGGEKVAEYISNLKRTNTETYTKYVSNSMMNRQSEILTLQYTKYFESIPDIMLGFYTILTPFPLSSMWFVFFGCIISLIVGLIKNRRIPWVTVGLCAFFFTHCFVSTYAAQTETARLCCVALPALYLLIGMLFNNFARDCKKQRKSGCFA